ncbi:hypothetical protein EOA79_02585 [Mesorhizobium sp. M1A.F.Ca.IN.020.03.2.1]|uniref:hypothetical protein n=1 Tax=Mesorhizobium sp. M1A.F.Ca.IN.020.03.2.1 TaxID=2496769 RepID=UPI000FD5FDA7|nr:hypothetical protein [Mesorhizobium sp. M1A.F.Ca.IN.020.03.2.1]RUV07994.1 hypothetical protein EOA79_02585 [Mesorhizobium sp. M1A.F.Ca.IN.020.03.2.1]
MSDHRAICKSCGQTFLLSGPAHICPGLAPAAPQAVPAEDVAGLVERLNDIITDQRADQREYGGAAVNPDVLSEAAAALTSLSAERDALAKKVQAFRNDGLVQAAIARQGALQEELDEAREANRKLHRRVQKFEGAETSFRMSFASWAKVLFRAESTPERRPDFESWQREIDKEFASGRAEAAEARATGSEAEASDLRRKLEERNEALKPFATFSDHKTSYVELPVRWCIAAARTLAASPSGQTDGGGDGR